VRTRDRRHACVVFACVFGAKARIRAGIGSRLRRCVVTGIGSAADGSIVPCIGIGARGCIVMGAVLRRGIAAIERVNPK
jgi:hypothetical protein